MLNFLFLQDFQSSNRIGELQTGIMSGLTDEIAWVTLPDSQLMTSDLSGSEPHVCLDWDEAVKQDTSYKATSQSKMVQKDSTKCIQTSHVSSVSLSEVVAAREGSSYENLIMKMIEVKQVSDEVKVCYTGDTLSLEKAFQSGVIPASVYVNILQRQKTRQDKIYPTSAKNVSLLEPEQETEPCEVNRLILNCLSSNKSLILGRNITTLSSVCDGLGDHETMLRFIGDQVGVVNTEEGQNLPAEMSEDVGGLQNGDRLKVDACVQCDLMSCSSTLVMLGNQWQFMGLVLPHSGEIQTVSSSYRYDQQITTDEFTSRLFSNRQKIAALYIPENSEVVDINSATQNGFIDSYTAEFLKSIEIPDVFPDLDSLKEKFSSWLMYKKLKVDGCYHAADCIKNENAPISTEERHLFISYLMTNSYIDPKSGQRVLILDKQLAKMVKLFLEDLISSEKTEKSVTSLNLNISDLSEQIDLDIPLHTNNETEEFMKSTQHTFTSHDFVSSVNGRINFDENTEHMFDPHSFTSSENGRVTFDEYAYAGDKTLKQDPVEDFSDTTEPDRSEKNMFQNNTSWKKSDEHTERICENTLTVDAVGAESEALDILTSLEMSVLPTLCPVKSTNVGSTSKMCDSDTSVKPCCQTVPRYDAESLCSEPRNIDINPAKILRSRASVESENERDNALHLLKAQLEEGGILDVTSGRRYDLEEALKKGLVDETTVLRLLDLQSGEKGSVLGEEEGTLSDLKQMASDGSISSNIALSIIEQQSLLGSDSINSSSRSLQSELVTDADNILNLYPKASIYPEGNCSHSISADHNLHLIKINEAENIQDPTDSEVAVIGLDLANEEEDKKDIETESRDASDCVTRGNVEETSNYLHQSTSAVSSYEPLVSSPSSWSQVTAEYMHHTDTSRLLAEGGDSQEVIDSMLTDRADVSHVVIENTVQSHQSSLNDRTSNSDPETQTPYVSSAFHSCNSDSSPTGNDFYITRYSDVKVGNQTVYESELDVSSPHCNVLFEESRMGNDTSAVHSPLGSELAQSIDDSSPRDLVESAFLSVSKGHWNYDKNITVEGSRITLPQQAELHSESDFIVESEPGCSQNGQKQLNNSSQSTAVSSQNNTATNTFSHRSCDMENSTNNVSLKTVPTNKDLFNSEHRGAYHFVDLHTERLSPERQHVDSFSHTEQMSVSRNEKEQGNVNANVTCLSPSSLSCDINSGQSETIMGERLGSGTLTDRKGLDVHASENPQVVTDFQSDSSITSDAASSAPSAFSNAVKNGVDDQGEMITKGTNVSDLQKAPTQDIESTIAVVQSTQGLHERDTPHELGESSRPDLQMDLLTQKALSLNNKEEANSELILQEEKVHKSTEQSDAPHIQLQLLQVLKAVSSSQDLSMLQEVMDTLNSALGGSSQEDQWHTLESIKEESSEGEEDEGSAEDHSDLSNFGAESHGLSPQLSAKAVACKVEEVKKKVHKFYVVFVLELSPPPITF